MADNSSIEDYNEPSTTKPNANANASGDGDHLVTESLLSWAKDVRYVREIQTMLVTAAEAMFSRSIAPSILYKGAWYTSYLLYLLMIVGRKGRTLGMEATGLEFANSGSAAAASKRRLVGVLMALGLGTWALDWWATQVDRESESQSEGLRGSDRQRRHELLRQQMFQRARSSTMSSNQSTVVHSNRSQSRPSNSNSEESSYRGKAVKKVQNVIKSLVRSIGESTGDGPHNLPIRNDGSPTSRSVSLMTWILRLHLAQYLITGRFPTILHRILGLRHQQQTKDAHSRVPVKPGTHRVVALLIATQGSASLIRCVLKWWTDRVALYLERRNATRMIENEKTTQLTQRTTRNASQYPILSVCAICRTPRTQPAVSSSCGHIFCWSCLTHWVSSVKEACPYCRAPCRLEDIQPLYNYDQVSQESSFSSIPGKKDEAL